MGLRTLVAGAGGREYALLWKLAQSPRAGELFCAPGNGGTTSLAHNLPVRCRDVERLVAAGLADGLIAADIPVFGPTKAAARIETSKAYAKELMTEIGVLYAGLILTDSGPFVLEINARFGDPETQALLPLLDVEVVDLCLAAANGALTGMPPIPTPVQSSIAVVIASGGNPGPHRTGLPIEGVNNLPADVLLFHGATRRIESDQFITGGDRVLTLVGLGNSLEAARANAYAGVDAIRFEGAHFRRDIGG